MCGRSVAGVKEVITSIAMSDRRPKSKIWDPYSERQLPGSANLGLNDRYRGAKSSPRRAHASGSKAAKSRESVNQTIVFNLTNAKKKRDPRVRGDDGIG